MTGRTRTTGRFDTREELEEQVWFWWLHSPLKQAHIARRVRVSETTVANIIEQKIEEVDSEQTDRRPIRVLPSTSA